MPFCVVFVFVLLLRYVVQLNVMSCHFVLRLIISETHSAAAAAATAAAATVAVTTIVVVVQRHVTPYRVGRSAYYHGRLAKL
jgi:hypothetical protein